jgi:predicted lysophospholipase L1 biosynthesis ABC-type transport system permease subunit
LLAFYWHCVRQTHYLFGAMLLTLLAVALIGTMIQEFLGQLERLMQAAQRSVVLADAFQSFSRWPRWWAVRWPRCSTACCATTLWCLG